jgi:hypothetical protein
LIYLALQTNLQITLPESCNNIANGAFCDEVGRILHGVVYYDNTQTLLLNKPQPDFSDTSKKTTAFPAPIFIKPITSHVGRVT